MELKKKREREIEITVLRKRLLDIEPMFSKVLVSGPFTFLRIVGDPNEFVYVGDNYQYLPY